ncbi:cyclic nucleotide-binding domain-containing protein [Labedaea rhizosphaerae]|uniref:Cyclic nucleotide-binding protein n=1 Tax=Labedaea rhizosphaerae TaxID=598644 RepID=A0A4R6SFN2_LABRH|nr:cyclic nucleotide-binding domain-containing protein [Labedaea rhizosphaerae]TDQ00307.1 cyclic nucleotide-binding protein [Labedaea rhizosphaerae]
MRRKDLRRFTAVFPDLAEALRNSGVRRLLFAARPVRFETGTSLVQRGQLTGDLYLVLDGSVHLTADADRTAVLWTVGPGGSVGGSGFVDPGVAELYAVAASPCTTLWLRHDQFVALAATEPRLVQALLDFLAVELLRSRDRLATLFSRLRMENLA